MTAFLYFFVEKPPNTLLDKLNNLPGHLELTVVMVGIGLATVIVAAPTLKWAAWRCPRGGNKFALHNSELAGALILLYVAWRLVSGRRCATCGFSRGDSA
jgi:hypothetical protein